MSVFVARGAIPSRRGRPAGLSAPRTPPSHSGLFNSLMALTEQEVARIARLARLQLTPGQQSQAQADLNKIFGLIQELQAVDTRGVEPLAHPLSAVTDVALRLRDDIVTEMTSTQRRAALMANGPGVRDGLFLVPKVIE
jgi:aspartyl-tRNA(Asn)/glutamyl-tRNA(Gln) amidotransferase subunit C